MFPAAFILFVYIYFLYVIVGVGGVDAASSSSSLCFGLFLVGFKRVHCLRRCVSVDIRQKWHSVDDRQETKKAAKGWAEGTSGKRLVDSTRFIERGAYHHCCLSYLYLGVLIGILLALIAYGVGCSVG